MKQRLLALLCAALLLAGLASCGPKPQTDPTQESTTTPVSETNEKKTIVTLPYTSADVLNPFQTRSRVNLDVTELLYDPLFQIDAAFEAVPVLAESADTQGTTVTVTLRGDVHFPKGGLLTARDVVYSFQYAKESPLFAARLENVFSAAAQADDVVAFTLVSPDPYAVNCLDFPVVRFSTADANLPDGTGRYLAKADKDGKVRLLRNEATSSFDEVEFLELALYDIRETVNALPLVEIGQLTCFLLDPAKQTVEKVGGRMETVHMNNLVFCGMNSSGTFLQDTAVRRAISLAVDKLTLAERAFSGAAVAAQTPFHPAWSALDPNMQTPVYDTDKADELLKNAGYVYPESGAKLREKEGTPLTLRLLVNSENKARNAAAKLLQGMLMAVGIGTELESVDYNSYVARIKSGGFDLYLGEVKEPANMSLSAFFGEEGGAHYGIDLAGGVPTCYRDLCAGGVEMATFIKVFTQEVPFLPLCFRDAYLYYTGELVYEGEVSENALLSNLYTWSLKGS